jgi:hypothetical protein
MKLSAGLALLALAAASPEMKYFQYQRPITGLGQATGQSCLVLDAGVFAHAAPQLADLRLYRDGAETPFVIRVAAPAVADEKQILPLNLGQRGGQTVFDANLPEGHYSDLQLAVTGQDFIATVTVTGSRQQSGIAQTKVGSFTIFDFTRQKLGRSTVLHLPESDFRFLHFSIKGPLTPESITGLTVMRLPTSQPKYLMVAESAQASQKEHRSILEFTVPAHVPLDRISFTPGAEPSQFSRDVSIRVDPIAPSPTLDSGRLVQPASSQGNLLRVHRHEDGHSIDEERLAIEAPQADFNTLAKWTITIDNGDNPPLKLESVRLEMLERNFCFDASANGSYSLYYGDPALTAPSYDYATLFAPQANPARVTAGPEVRNPIFEPRPDERPFTEKHPALLWIALLAVIGLLGAIALRSTRRSTPTPP